MDKYRKLRKIGQGSFGRVYLIENEINHTKYVLKEVDLCDFGADGKSEVEANQEALAEVYYLNKLHNHPNIVSIIECFESEKMKILYIVMEYAEGGDLEHQIKQRAETGHPYPEYQIIDWLVQICLAVKHIHDRKIIHRDIKTPNVFICDDGSIKLGDFGIARTFGVASNQAMTKIGTPFYMSPEICMEKAYDHMSDMWALGVVLYEMLCFSRPFDGQDLTMLTESIIHQQHGSIPDFYSPELQHLVDRLLNKDPQRRLSIDQVLNLPFLQPHIQRFLPNFKMGEHRAPEPSRPEKVPTSLSIGYFLDRKEKDFRIEDEQYSSSMSSSFSSSELSGSEDDLLVSSQNKQGKPQSEGDTNTLQENKYSQPL